MNHPLLDFRTFMENQQAFDWDAYYAEMEPRILANPQVRQELAQNFDVKSKTIQQVLGVSEGQANFLSRMINKKYGDSQKAAQADSARRNARAEAASKDGYLYHVTTKRNLAKIRRQGLRPDSPSQFSNYQGYSQGKVFLCEKGGVNFWKEKVEAHEAYNKEQSGAVVVLRIPRQAVTDLQPDTVGTKDSRYPAYFTTQPISKQNIELVQ